MVLGLLPSRPALGAVGTGAHGAPHGAQCPQVDAQGGLCAQPVPAPPRPGVDMISKMLKMQMLEDEDDLAYAETEKKARPDSSSDGRPAWMRTLHTTASNWLHLIPQTLSHLKRTVENIKVAAPRLISGGSGSPRGWGRAGRGECCLRAGVRLGQARGLGLECPRVEDVSDLFTGWSGTAVVRRQQLHARSGSRLSSGDAANPGLPEAEFLLVPVLFPNPPSPLHSSPLSLPTTVGSSVPIL